MRKASMACIIVYAVLIASLISCERTQADEIKQSASDMETSPVSTIENSTDEPESAYVDYLRTLPCDTIDSIPKALEKYKALATTDKALNDSMFRSFEDFFHSVQNSISDELFPEDVLEVIIIRETEGFFSSIKNPVDIDDHYAKSKALILRQNGFAVFSGESGSWLIEDPYFLLVNFSGYVSAGVVEYIKLASNDRMYGCLTDDAALVISWDELADKIIAWENYAAAYPLTPEAETAMLEAKSYFSFYITADFLDNTPMFVNDKLTDDVKSSYERFVDLYYKSTFHDIISSYYALLEHNDFRRTEEAVEFLAGYDLIYWSMS